jgi:hypothetical protein
LKSAVVSLASLALTGFATACDRPADAAPEGSCLTPVSEAVIVGGPDGFHRLSGLAVGVDGQIFVLDGGDKRLTAYDTTGRVLWRQGREGDGPGELRQPDGVSVVGAAVAVRDHGPHRLSLWSANGELIGVRPLSEFGFAGYPGWFAPLSRDRVVAMSMPPLRMGSNAGLPGAVVIGTRGGTGVDTLATFSFPAPQMVRTGGVALPVMPDFAPYPRVTSTRDGTVYVSREGSYRIERFSPAGEAIGTVHGPADGPPFSAADREHALAKLPDGTPADDIAFPASLPAVAGLTTSAQGDLLVRTHFRDGAAVRWDRWSARGDYVHSMMLPARFAYFAFDGDRLAVIESDSLEVHTVGIHRLAGATDCAGPLPGR